MQHLAGNFSIALICIIIAVTMIATIFDGKADTSFNYIVSIFITVVATLVFGIVASDIVHAIVGAV